MQIKELKHGAPCWFELASTDPEKSFEFYSRLFGWRRTDMNLGAMGTYSFLDNANGTIGAFCSMQEEQKSHGIPSHWSVYFAVDDCDATTSRVAEHGGTIIMSPFEVQGHGRMSVIGDPSGAVFCLWQAKATDGNFVMFEDHSMGWVELATRDSAKARDFYAALLGWTFHESHIPVPDSGNYIEISVGETRYGGILPMNKEWGDIPPHWAVYIFVPDVDTCCANAIELGGSNPLPAFEAPGVGRISMISDPTGATCYVICLSQKNP